MVGLALFKVIVVQGAVPVLTERGSFRVRPWRMHTPRKSYGLRHDQHHGWNYLGRLGRAVVMLMQATAEV